MKISKLLSRVKRSVSKRLSHLGYLAGAREESARSLDRAVPGTILVLCYGNIYRSPFAANRLAALLVNTQWAVKSAGFFHKENRSCVNDMVELAKSYDVNLEDHRSKKVSTAALDEAELIVIMDSANRELLADFSDLAIGKVVWIAAYSNRIRADIQDPYGLSSRKLNQIVCQLNDGIETLASRLKLTNS